MEENTAWGLHMTLKLLIVSSCRSWFPRISTSSLLPKILYWIVETNWDGWRREGRVFWRMFCLNIWIFFCVSVNHSWILYFFFIFNVFLIYIMWMVSLQNTLAVRRNQILNWQFCHSLLLIWTGPLANIGPSINKILSGSILGPIRYHTEYISNFLLKRLLTN